MLLVRILQCCFWYWSPLRDLVFMPAPTITGGDNNVLGTSVGLSVNSYYA